uniref:hypothetical protein n=1 Tax=Aliarcobacter sp. TaxID=2321116 RepID=UPI004047064C
MYKINNLKIIILMLFVSLFMSGCAVKNILQNEVSGTVISYQFKSILTEKGPILRKSYNLLGSYSGFYVEDKDDKILNIKVGDYVYLNVKESIIQVDRKNDGSSTLYKFDKKRENLIDKIVLKKGKTSTKSVVAKKVEEKKIIKKADIDDWR